MSGHFVGKATMFFINICWSIVGHRGATLFATIMDRGPLTEEQLKSVVQGPGDVEWR